MDQTSRRWASKARETNGMSGQALSMSRLSLRAKVILTMVAFLGLIMLVVGMVLFHGVSEQLSESFAARGHILSRTIASSSTVHVFYEQREEQLKQIHSMVTQEDYQDIRRPGRPSAVTSPTAAACIRHPRLNLLWEQPSPFGSSSAISGNGPRPPICPIPGTGPRLVPWANTTASSCAIKWFCAAVPAPHRPITYARPTATSSIPTSAGSSWGCD